MIEIQFTVEDENETRLREVADLSPGILDGGLRATAREFRNYTRRHYLSGQVFYKRTGKMWADFHYGRYRRATHDFIVSGGPRILNIFAHSGGADIRPTQKFLRFPNINSNPKFKEYVFVRYIHLPPRWVMEPAAAAFNFQSSFKKNVDKLIEKAIMRRFKEISGV